MSWGLAIDYGTSFTAGAVAHEGVVELVEVEDSPRFPSAVLLDEGGSLLTGRAAVNQARRYPERFERSPKRLVGQAATLLGGAAAEVAEMVGAVLRRVGDAARIRQGSTAPDWVRLTHPAGWGPERQDVLREAARRAGLGEVELMSEPEAAAWFFVEDRRGEEPLVAPGGCVAVYDLGGGTFDTAILRRSEDGFSLAGPPGGLDWFGGEDFDQRLLDFVLGRVYERDEETWRSLKEPTGAQARRARLQLREDVRQAKEALSSTPSVSVPVATSTDDVLDVPVTREEFERLIRDDLERTVGVLEKTVRDAGITFDEVTAVYLTGGSSRVPLAGELASRLHSRVYTRPDPKTLVARGAIAARRGVAPAPAPPVASPTVPVPEPEPEPVAPATPEPEPVAPTPSRAREPRARRQPPRQPAEILRDRRVQLGAAIAGGVLLVIIAVAAMVGNSGDPELDVTTAEFVKGTRNVARVSGTVDPSDAEVSVRGRPARVRDGEWEVNARPGPGGEMRVAATDGDERASEVVTVPAPRLDGTWNVLQADVYANSVAGGELRRGRSAWRFQAICGDEGCSGSVLEFPSPGGVTRIRLHQRGKMFTGLRRYKLPRSGICLGKARSTRWTTRIELTVTDWRTRKDALVGRRFRGIARHRSRFQPSLPCDGGRLITRLRGSTS